LVSLLNADAVLTGSIPSFGEAILLDLGGLRVRARTWSPVHNAVLMIGGPKDGSKKGGVGTFRGGSKRAATLASSTPRTRLDNRAAQSRAIEVGQMRGDAQSELRARRT
jgi:hypothetical protein